MARRTADVVLEGEDLCALLAAVGEGRTVHDNLRRATRFLLATNLSEVLLVLAGALMGRQALTPMQLLWINLLTDTAPAIALALERGEDDLMRRAPPGRGLGLTAPADRRAIARDGALMAALGQAALVVGGPGVAFAGLTGAQISYAARCRASGAPASRRLVAAVGGAAALQLAAVSVAPLRTMLGSGGPVALVAFAVGLCAPLLAGETGDEIVFRPASAGSPAGVPLDRFATEGHR
jgi:Ca2+-transporting ATPase